MSSSTISAASAISDVQPHPDGDNHPAGWEPNLLGTHEARGDEPDKLGRHLALDMKQTHSHARRRLRNRDLWVRTLTTGRI